MNTRDEAIEFVMEFYDVTYDECVAYYEDEIRFCMTLMEWKNEREDKSSSY